MSHLQIIITKSVVLQSVLFLATINKLKLIHYSRCAIAALKCYFRDAYCNSEHARYNIITVCNAFSSVDKFCFAMMIGFHKLNLCNCILG